MFWCFIPDINECVNNIFWDWGKLRFLNKLSYKHSVCRVCEIRDKAMVLGLFRACFFNSLARLPTETARVIFLSHFLKKRALSFFFCFSYLFNASTRLFCTLSFAQSRKIVSKFSKLSAILKRRGKTLKWLRQSCVRPLIDHRQEPIKMRE